MPIPPFARTSRQAGFSLMEMLVVVVIIGLLAGGALVGSDMIRQANLRTVTAEVDRYTKAAKLFQDRYMALPGDMSNATTEWGAANADPTTCKTTVGTGTQTCNGNGDGKVADVTDSWPLSPQLYESVRFWQQLVNAGFIEGSYNGVFQNGGIYGSTPGISVPKVMDTCLHFEYDGMVNDSYNWSSDGGQKSIGHVFILGGFQVIRCLSKPNLSPVEAQSLDAKFDDGKPQTGNIITFRQELRSSYYGGDDGTIPCVTSNVYATAEYNTTYDTAECSLIFLTGF